MNETTEIRATARPTRLDAGLEPLAQFAAEMQAVQTALDALSASTGQNATKAVDRLRRDLEEFEPTVTVLGQVKAGKTALVNAMAGWADLLPSDVNPWTSVVTSLHLTPATEPSETGACFRFMKEEEWDRLLQKGGRMGELASRAGAESELQKISLQIEKVREKARERLGRKFELLIGEEHDYGYFDKNLLEKYICLGDDFDSEPDAADQGRFADILRSADLYLNCVTVPCRLCLRDTPGVNDTFMMREQITVQAIRDSRLCVVVLSGNQALTSVDMGLIRLISNLESRQIVIFVNRIDELSAPSRQIPEIEKNIRQTLRDKQGPDGVEIVFGSAYWANKVLSGDIENMSGPSEAALLDWAEATLAKERGVTEPHDIVWELSGLPGLFGALSDRIVEDLGAPFLKRVAGSAVTVATSQQAAGKVDVEGGSGPAIGAEDATREFEALAERHLEALDSDISRAVADYHQRADRAHAKFIERATQSLVAHLEQHGPKVGWKYDPTGLRVLLRSAHSVFGKHLQTAASERYEAALMDVAELYSRAFGDAVSGIQLSAPSAPRIPPPVALGQTIALDFNDGWWVSWWQRLRGYDVFARQFRQLIAAETEDFMVQLKSGQAEEARRQVMSALRQFLDEQRDLLREINGSATDREGIRDLVHGRRGAGLGEDFDDMLSALRAIAA